jgi:DNA-binding transcriptional LysR family regulator
MTGMHGRSRRIFGSGPSQSRHFKGIQALEASTRLSLFDRSHRGARLTEQGEQLLALGREMLDLEQRILGLKDAERPPAGRLRLGVTEMSALSWLPRLVAAIRDAHPTLILEHEVDMSRNLMNSTSRNSRSTRSSREVAAALFSVPHG